MIIMSIRSVNKSKVPKKGQTFLSQYVQVHIGILKSLDSLAKSVLWKLFSTIIVTWDTIEVSLLD